METTEMNLNEAQIAIQDLGISVPFKLIQAFTVLNFISLWARKSNLLAEWQSVSQARFNSSMKKNKYSVMLQTNYINQIKKEIEETNTIYDEAHKILTQRKK